MKLTVVSCQNYHQVLIVNYSYFYTVVMKALKLASSDSIRQAICTQKHLLFGDYLIESVGNEWISFLSLI